MNQGRARRLEALLAAALLALSYIFMDAIFSQLFYELFLMLGVPEDFLSENLNIPFTLSTVAMILAYWLLWRRTGGGREKKGISLPPLGGAAMMLVIALGGAGLSTLWLSLADGLLSEFLFVRESLETMNGAFSDMGEGSYFWALMYISVAGPVVEELLFRGLIFSSLERGFQRTDAAIVLSALMFGIWHGIFVQTVYTTVIGMVFAYVYAKTRDLRWTVLLHFFNNFLGTLPPPLDTEAVALALDKICVLFIPLMLFLLFRIGRAEKKEKTA